MEKMIKIGDRNIPVSSNAGSLLRYKSNFGRDGLADMFQLSKGVKVTEDENGEEITDLNESFDIGILYRFLWVFAKSADKTISPLEDWLSEFDMKPFDFATEVLPQIMDLLATSAKTEEKAKKKLAQKIPNALQQKN